MKYLAGKSEGPEKIAECSIKFHVFEIELLHVLCQHCHVETALDTTEVLANHGSAESWLKVQELCHCPSVVCQGTMVDQPLNALGCVSIKVVDTDTLDSLVLTWVQRRQIRCLRDINTWIIHLSDTPPTTFYVPR